MPSLLNAGYQENVIWNGKLGAYGKNIETMDLWETTPGAHLNKKGLHGLETQAFAALAVHNQVKGTEEEVAQVLELIKNEIPEYQEKFNEAFFDKEGEKMSHENLAFALAAYARSLITNQAPFQKWLRGEVTAMTEQEKKGAVLFFGKANCISCHSGPALNSMEFYAVGVKDFKTHQNILVNKENINTHLGRYSFTRKDSDRYKFKVPQLYNLKDQTALTSGGNFRSIRDLIEYKNLAISENADVVNIDIKKLDLNKGELDDLETFLKSGLYDPNIKRYYPESIPSGFCFPNNDSKSNQESSCTAEP